jgi:hypothetical protein
MKNFTNEQLKDVIRKYNLKTKIVGYSKMKKEDLINSILLHLNYTNNQFTLKTNVSIPKPKAELKLKTEAPKPAPNVYLIKLRDIKDIIKRFTRGDIENNKKYYEDSLVYSLNYQYDNYTPEIIKTNHEIFDYLKHNLEEMEVSKNTKESLKKWILDNKK